MKVQHQKKPIRQQQHHHPQQYHPQQKITYIKQQNNQQQQQIISQSIPSQSNLPPSQLQHQQQQQQSNQQSQQQQSQSQPQVQPGTKPGTMLVPRKVIENYSYNMTEIIGKGYSSQVFKGKDDRPGGEQVAVKVIDMKKIKNEVQKFLLQNEIAIIKRLNNYNLLDTKDVFQTQNNTYIITELCNHGDLKELLVKYGKLSESAALKILRHILNGMRELVSQNIIHRDIKPANILLSEGVPKIADFGFSQDISGPPCKYYYNVGTPMYMCPQALKKNQYSYKSDIWSLGVLYYELLYGTTPWQATTEQELIHKITHQPVLFPKTPVVSDLSKDFILKCLDVDENKRMGPHDLEKHPLITQQVQKEIQNKLKQEQEQKEKDDQAQHLKEQQEQQDQLKLKQQQQEQDLYKQQQQEKQQQQQLEQQQLEIQRKQEESSKQFQQQQQQQLTNNNYLDKQNLNKENQFSNNNNNYRNSPKNSNQQQYQPYQQQQYQSSNVQTQQNLPNPYLTSNNSNNTNNISNNNNNNNNENDQQQQQGLPAYYQNSVSKIQTNGEVLKPSTTQKNNNYENLLNTSNNNQAQNTNNNANNTYNTSSMNNQQYYQGSNSQIKNTSNNNVQYSPSKSNSSYNNNNNNNNTDNNNNNQYLQKHYGENKATADTTSAINTYQPAVANNLKDVQNTPLHQQQQVSQISTQNTATTNPNSNSSSQNTNNFNEEFMQNDMIILAQINFCRFLVRLQKLTEEFSNLETPYLKERVILLILKNVMIKISKLKEMCDTKQNLFYLTNFQNYIQNESFKKFILVINEYHVKYTAIYQSYDQKISQKHRIKEEMQADKKFDSIFDGNFYDTESFYHTLQIYLRYSIHEINHIIKQSLNEDKDDVPSAVEGSIVLLDYLVTYFQLSHLILERFTDHSFFAQASKIEQIAEGRPVRLTKSHFAQIRNKIYSLEI